MSADGPRVLHLSWEYPPVVEGGLGRHVSRLSDELVRRGVHVEIITRGGEGLPAVATQAGVVVHRVHEPPWPPDIDRFVAWVGTLNRAMLAAGESIVAEGGFDLVHGHDWLVATAAVGLADRLRVPFVTTIHATEHGRHQGRVDAALPAQIHAIERWMARRANRVITCSHYMRGQIEDVFDVDERHIMVIPNGIDALEPIAPPQRAEVRARWAAPHEKLVLLVGRLVYEKGFQLALDALPGVIERVGDVRFVVAGSGIYGRELRAQAESLGLAERGTFLGWVGDDVLHDLYHVADVCVIPSIYEPFGLVALEAMACGCPCLVADTGGLREIVSGEDIGLSFPARDGAALGDALERMLGDRALRDGLALKASEQALRFAWAGVAESTHALYSELSERRAGLRA